MDQTPQEPSLDDSVKQVMQTLPPPIKEYLAAGKYSLVAQNLMKKYGLHIDQGTILEREMMLLLMGIENPQEFNEALIQEAKIDAQAASNIMLDVNAQIFIPLRDQMRSGESVPPPSNPAAPAPSVPRYAPPPPVRPTPTNVAAQPAVVLPTSAPVSQLPVSAVSAPASPMEAVRLATPPANPPLSSAPRPYSVDPYREPTDEGGQ